MNRKIVLLSRPEGKLSPSNFSIETETLSTTLQSNQILVRVEYLSIDSDQRVWISGGKSYVQPVNIGSVVKSIGVGWVVASRSHSLKKGNFVSGFFGWQAFSIVNASNVTKLPSYENPQLYLGVLGLTGLTAFFAVTEVAKPQRQEVMVVSAAAGSVGSIACQIGKLKGCKVIAICGSDEKCKWLKDDLKVHACINYKKESHLGKALRKVCPEGVDIGIDCVGGRILDGILANIRKGARIVLCGNLSTYESGTPIEICNYPVAISMSSSLEGFVVWDYQNRFEMGLKQLSRWVQEKKILYREKVIEGLENAPMALQMVLDGENIGKVIVKVMHEQPKL